MPALHATFIAMFNEPIRSWLNSSLIARAHKNGILSTRLDSILESVSFNHHLVDDTPYGGGPGELIKIDIIAPLIEKALAKNQYLTRDKKRVLLMDPAGHLFTQNDAKRLSTYEELIFICGRYEGIDARVHYYVDEALSIGDFVLSSGDIAAMAIFDATVRMVDGVLGNRRSGIEESHFNGRLEGSHYTRPHTYEGFLVPDVFQSGDHAEIEKTRLLESIHKTRTLRPDLIKKYPLSNDEEKIFAENKDQLLCYPWTKPHV